MARNSKTKPSTKKDKKRTMNQKQTELATLIVKIERARQRLHDLWDQRGCTDYDVLKAGMVLDELINEYEKRKNSEQ